MINNQGGAIKKSSYKWYKYWIFLLVEETKEIASISKQVKSVVNALSANKIK